MYHPTLNPLDLSGDLSEIGLNAFASPEFAESLARALVEALETAAGAASEAPPSNQLRIAA